MNKVKHALFAAALFCLGGCVPTHSFLTPDVGATVNPAQGMAVKVGTVRDLRQFEATPRNPSRPSLEDKEDINNPTVVARAIGRKRDGFGEAFGDVQLPQGMTVAGLFRDAATVAFRRAGYRVLTTDDPGYAEAPAVDLQILEYWNWCSPGALRGSLESRTEVRISAPLPGWENGVSLKGYAIVYSGTFLESDWQDIVNRGMADFQNNLQTQLRKRP